MPPQILDNHVLYQGWNRLLMVKVRTALGSMISRSIEDHGSAVAVLIFDPERRVALMVRQLRVGILFAFGVPSLLEVPAGLLEGDDPADCARREAMEEAGVKLGALTPLGKVFPMAGISTEAVHLFLAEYQASDRVTEGGGLIEETEEIEVVEIALKDLAADLDAGRLPDMKTFALVQTLRLRRPDLFA